MNLLESKNPLKPIAAEKTPAVIDKMFINSRSTTDFFLTSISHLETLVPTAGCSNLPRALFHWETITRI